MEHREPTPDEIFGSYTAWKLDEVTWIISFMNGSEYIYLFEGEEYALLTDTGYGRGQLRKFVEKLTDKKVLVTNTHYHPDHSAGNGEWEKVYLSAGWTVDAPAVERPGAGPYDLASYPYPDYEKCIVGSGYQFDLGKRTVEVIEALPAHCNSSLFFYDRDHDIIVTGDEFESSQTMMFDNSRNPEAPYDVTERILNMQRNAKKLLELTTPHTFILPNHNGTPISRKYLCDYIELADAIFDGSACIEDKLNHRYVEMDPTSVELCRVRHKNCSIFIKKKDVLSIYGTKNTK